MNSRIELKGLARFSPRQQMLHRIASNDSNPFIKHLAYQMLVFTNARNRKRKINSIHSVFTNLFPQTIVLAGYYFSNYMSGLHEAGIESDVTQRIVDFSAIPFFLFIGMGVFLCIFVSLMTGLVFLLYPGTKILSKDPHGATLGYFANINPNRLHFNLIKFQTVNYLMPMVAAYFSSMAVYLLMAVGENGIAILEQQNIILHLSWFAWYLTFEFGLMLAGLWAGFSVNNGCLASVQIIACLALWIYLLQKYTSGFDSLLELNVTLDLLVINLIMCACFYYLSKTIITRRILPEV